MEQKFKQFSGGINYPKVEERILQFWKANKIFEKSVEKNDINKTFTFYEGPPTANGKPGLHHVIARTLKDLVCRYKTIQGYRVNRKAGWDTHGLPVEIEVEKKDKDILPKIVRDYEPEIALFYEVGLYQRLIEQSAIFLREGGLMALETGYNQAKMVKGLIEDMGKFTSIEITKDLNGIERVISAVKK